MSLDNKPSVNVQTKYTYSATTPDTTCNNGVSYTLGIKDTTSLKVGDAAAYDINTYSPVDVAPGCQLYVNKSPYWPALTNFPDLEMPKQTQLQSKQTQLTTQLVMEQLLSMAAMQVQKASKSAAPDSTMPAKQQTAPPHPQAASPPQTLRPQLLSSTQQMETRP